MKIVAGVLACLALLTPVQASAQEDAPRVFEPAGPWTMEYANDACLLVRDFSSGDMTMTLGLARFSLGASLRIGVASDGLRAGRSAREAKFRYTSDTRSRTSSLYRSNLSDGRESFHLRSASLIPLEELQRISRRPAPGRLATLRDMEIAAAAGISSISFTGGFDEDFVIQVGSMTAPIKAMQACATDLVASWGIDPQRLDTMSRPASPIGNYASWANTDDYPPETVRQSNGREVGIVLIISEAGEIERCIVDVAVPGSFETTACEAVTRRARFLPGLDAEGNPMRSYWTMIVRL